MTEFVSLHNQTYFSILDSLVSPKDLFKRAKELNQHAVAITDHGTLASAWDALKASKDSGVKLIIGCECYFQNEASNTEDKFRHIVLLAKNAIGYKNLLTLNKKGFDQSSFVGKRVYSVLDWKLLEQYSEGLICLTACGNGVISQLLMNKKYDEAEKTLLRLKDLFKENLAIEVQPNNMKRGYNFYNDEIDQQFLNRRLIDLGKKFDIKVVPACNTHYLNKEDASVHDVFLAIGSHQPVYSNFRLKYNVPEFYLKSGDDVQSFFSRNYGDDFANEICANTIYFANMCENPEWIDPKFSNPSGKELPIFPVKDEPDYEEFSNWKSTQDEDLLKLDEDKLYLRFKCFNAFNKIKDTLPIDQHINYINRINTELDVLEYQGFSSYMLIVSDYVNWCIKQDIPVGPGRGCVQGNTQVLTSNGFKDISSIKVGENVYSHSGNERKVLNTFSFDVNEEKVLKIKTQKSFEELTLTKDHKLLGLKRKVFNTKNGRTYSNWNKTAKEPEWIEAKDLKKTDLLWMTYPKNQIIDYWNDGIIDLSQFSTFGIVSEDYIKYKCYKENKFSVSNISKILNINNQIIHKIKNNKNLNVKNKTKLVLNTLSQYLLENNMTLNDWQNLDTSTLLTVNRYINFTDKFYYIIGLWVGDGFLIYNKRNGKYGIGFSFNSKETKLVDSVKDYFTSIGFNVSSYKKKENAIQVECYSEILLNLFKCLIEDYNNKSSTKHFPVFFRNLNKNNLFSLINGLFDSDGCAKSSSEMISTTSKRLALEVKEALLYLNHASSVYKNKIYTKDGANRLQQYSINYSSLFDNVICENNNFYKKNGYYCRIASIKEVTIDKVYDIEIEIDHSYLTSNYASHNSCGGCYVAYLLGIHKADSLKYDLIFERFQNKLRMQAPDIDQDVSTLHRGKVLNYLKMKYGVNNVCAISNYNTITPKVYVRDLSRALEFGGSREQAVEVGNILAGMIPNDVSKYTDFDKILSSIPLLNEYCKKFPDLNLNSQIIGLPRSASQHAAGIIISQRELVGLVPLRTDKDKFPIIEYDKDLSEQNGLIKMDVLGLSTLDLIYDVVSEIKRNKKEFNNEHINYDDNDKMTYDLISRGDTFGVFQFGTSAGTVELCKQIKPKNIEDLAIITTLARPAAASIRNDFILTREGKKKVCMLHSSLEGAFKKTYGFGLFDESILQLGRDVAGWNYNEADRIRKMIKEKGKNPDKDRKLREEFINSSILNKIPAILAPRIWDEEVAKFASYTFNKSHAILYSMISYQTAYLKANFPIEFLIVNLMHEIKSNSPDAKDKIQKCKKELRNHKITILPPNINNSKLFYYLINENKLLTGLDALKFVSDDAINDIIEKRPFKNFFDFMSRVDSKKVRSNTIQALAASGALDSFKLPRKLIFQYCSDYRKKLQVWMKKHDPKNEEFIYPWLKEQDWSIPELYALEQFYLGEAFICKPKVAYNKFFTDVHSTVSDIKKAKDKSAIPSVKAIVREFFEFKVKKETSKYYGQSMIKAVIEDKNGEQCKLTIFPDKWSMVLKKIKSVHSKFEFDSGLALHFSGSTNNYEDDMGVVLEQLYGLCCQPPLPSDLKDKKKVNLKKDKTKETEDLLSSNDLYSHIEDILYDQGLIDSDESDY